MKVKCNNCGRIHELVIDWEEVGADERQMGPEIFYDFHTSKICTCGNIIDIDLEGSEYPVGDEIEICVGNVKNGVIV